MRQVKKVNPKYGTGGELKRMFKVSGVSISKALNGKTNSELAKKIRQAAINFGGDPIYEQV
ncbi:MAG: hypothetical protein FWG84_02390 [Bacteroidales bacterium]|nr:hypothetical protein [Bacteroidales bacterium]